jgi:hypothetical protein
MYMKQIIKLHTHKTSKHDWAVTRAATTRDGGEREWQAGPQAGTQI